MARLKLESAISNYKKGDMVATKHELEAAVEWLNRAAQNSTTDKSREESRKLGVKIDAFKETLNQSSEEHENSLTRFWHQSTAIIEREIDQLTHSYAELFIAEQSLKYLLDAKMHLHLASHDLFVSHNDEDSVQELDNVLDYLDEASQVSKTPIQKKIITLSREVNVLREEVKQGQNTWRNNDVILYLNQAIDNLTKAKDEAPPGIKSRIDSIEVEIRTLRIDVERRNIKNGYESAMAKLRDIINEL
jgi:flagellar hook-basal body complex protein FliE